MVLARYSYRCPIPLHIGFLPAWRWGEVRRHPLKFGRWTDNPGHWTVKHPVNFNGNCIRTSIRHWMKFTHRNASHEKHRNSFTLFLYSLFSGRRFCDSFFIFLLLRTFHGRSNYKNLYGKQHQFVLHWPAKYHCRNHCTYWWLFADVRKLHLYSKVPAENDSRTKCIRFPVSF